MNKRDIRQSLAPHLRGIAGFAIVIAACVIVACAGWLSAARADDKPADPSPQQTSPAPTDVRTPAAAPKTVEMELPAKGTCFTLDGKTFAWSWPNAPFGALRCETDK